MTGVVCKYAPDLGKDRFYVWLNKYHWFPLVVLAAALLAIGGLATVLVGHLCARGFRAARHLAGQFGHPYVGRRGALPPATIHAITGG